jgi:GDPmannose 4,6-dehydratase
MPPTPAKTALITGITGQDGSYLSDPRLVLHYGDLTDSTNLIRFLQNVQA